MPHTPILEKDTALKFPHALLISASAGSGKTYTLTQRYVQFLLSEKVPGNGLPGILAVTFTNNAAKEMKARILAWLKELALDKNCRKMDETLALVSLGREEASARAAALVDRIISDYSDFHIQTIDSFLARVMAASVDELGLPLKSEITMAYDALLDVALYSMFARIGKTDLPAGKVDEFLAVLPKTGSYPWNPVQRVKENFNSFLSQEGKTAGVLAVPEAGSEAGLKIKFTAALKLCSGLIKRFGKGLVKPSSAAALASGSITDFLASYSFTYGIFNGVKKSSFPENWEKDIELLNELVIELTELNAAAYYHPYAGIYDRFKAELELVKHGKTDVIHINDIAKKLSAYINAGNVPEIYLKLGERISHFLIDEFQDTNRLQWDVLRPLVEESISKAGSLFVVGDIKQAIYMFRNADYKIMRDFLDKAEGKKEDAAYISLEPLGGVLKYATLPVNYRSDGGILDHVNALFREKLKSAPKLIGADITELTACSQSVPQDRQKSGYVKTDILELDDIGEPVGQREWLLAAVRGAQQRYPLNEIAILVAKNKRIGPVVEWLTGAGIPVASLSSLDIRKRRVVAELIAYLKFLETPSDDLAFADFITGDIFTAGTGLPRGEMREFIFSARGAGSSGGQSPEPLLYSSFRKHAKYKEYWDKYLDEPFRRVGYLPLYELVSLIYGNFRIFDNFPGEQAFLSRFLDALNSLEAEGVSTPRSFIEYASGTDEDKAAVFAIALPDYLDAVRVMTFHKSKGLGFSVVINLMYDERDQSDPMYFEEKDGDIHVYHITRAAAGASAKLKPIYEGRKTDCAAQDLNVLYVVSTRARHELYNLIIRKVRKTAAKEPGILDLFETSETGKTAGRTAGCRKASKPVEICSSGAGPERRLDALKPACAGFFETAEGELVHGILARFIELPADLEGKLSVCFDEVSAGYPFRFDKPGIVKKLLAFLNCPAAAPLFAAVPGRQILAEAEFIDGAGALFRLDRVLIDKDAVIVADFKTGRENAVKHSAQMKNYLAIVSEVYGKKTAGVLAYVDLCKITEVIC